MPAGQASQPLPSTAPTVVLDWPAGQVCAQSPVAPVAALNVPAVQGAQVVDGSLSSSEKPGGQSLQPPGALVEASR
eukprot:COSAG04_NODE_3037_length_3249_cov_2.449524_3_plen_76_part_00